MRKLLLVAAISASVTACASRPGFIPPVSVSATEYSGRSCHGTQGMLEDKRNRYAVLDRQQKQAALGDAFGVLIFLVPVSSMLGQDQEAAIAQTKGEIAALERAVELNCNDPRLQW